MHPFVQDLDYLSEGLEGRCQSPIALLFDALLRPDTDIGGTMDSVLMWQRQNERAVPHVVLGRNLPGGAWHVSRGLGGGAQGQILGYGGADVGETECAMTPYSPCYLQLACRAKVPLSMQSIEGSMVTLSRGQWMGLPDLHVKDWLCWKRR